MIKCLFGEAINIVDMIYNYTESLRLEKSHDTNNMDANSTAAVDTLKRNCNGRRLCGLLIHTYHTDEDQSCDGQMDSQTPLLITYQCFRNSGWYNILVPLSLVYMPVLFWLIFVIQYCCPVCHAKCICFALFDTPVSFY